MSIDPVPPIRAYRKLADSTRQNGHVSAGSCFKPTGHSNNNPGNRLFLPTWSLHQALLSVFHLPLQKLLVVFSGFSPRHGASTPPVGTKHLCLKKNLNAPRPSVVLPAGEMRHRNLKKKWSLSGTFCCCATPKNNVGIYKVGLVNTGNNNLALWLSITKESSGCALFKYAPPFLVCPSFPTPTFLLVCSGHV